MLIDKNRLSHWYAVVLSSWFLYFVVIGIPIFCFLLSVSVFKVVLFVAIGCALQLSLTPWMFAARKTRENPSGKMGQLVGSVAVWGALNLLLVALFLQYGKQMDIRHREATILFDVLVIGIFGVSVFVGCVLGMRQRQ
jgi:hypothetical protein